MDFRIIDADTWTTPPNVVDIICTIRLDGPPSDGHLIGVTTESAGVDAAPTLYQCIRDTDVSHYVYHAAPRLAANSRRHIIRVVMVSPELQASLNRFLESRIERGEHWSALPTVPLADVAILATRELYLIDTGP